MKTYQTQTPLHGGKALDVLDLPRHIVQVDYVSVARNKATLREFVTEHADSRSLGHEIDKRSRIDGGSATVVALRDAGLLDVKETTVYAIPMSVVPGQKIARLEQDGTYTVVGQFRRDNYVLSVDTSAAGV